MIPGLATVDTGPEMKDSDLTDILKELAQYHAEN